MKPSAITVAVAACLLLLATTACDCGDVGIHEATPKLEKYHVSPTPGSPVLGDMTDLPETDRISVDFGLVDAGTVHHRYLFLRNSGKGELQFLGLELDPATSPDFILDYSQQDPLYITPGHDLVIEVIYAPAEAGADTGSFTTHFDLSEHQTVIVDLRGEAVTPEIQVCFADCEGAESDPSCAGAGELCNDQVDRDQFVLAFGDGDMDGEIDRVVTVRNQGQRTLQVERVDLMGGYNTQFSVDLTGSGIPGDLEPGQEKHFTVTFAPRWGGEHFDRMLVGSTDINEPEVLVNLSGRGVAPRVCPDPLLLDFGNVQVGVEAFETFDLESCGLEVLNLIDVSMADGSSADFSLSNLPNMPTDLAPGQMLPITVRYFPLTAGSDSGGAEIYSNDQSADPATGLTGTVVLIGNAVEQACDIQVTPFAVNFGVLEVGSSDTRDVLISNVGSDPCTLHDVQITTNTPANEFRLLASPPGGSTFDVGDTLSVSVGYDPTDVGQDTGILSLFANDKDTNEVRVDLNAFASPPEGEGPIAVCSVTPTQAVPFQTVTWNGSQSYDTNGRAIDEYRWEIFAFPPGSGAILWGVGATRTTEVDFAGDYIASLVVVNDLGQTSDRCYATTTVTPTQDLWIEMYWQYSGDDMDLHLLAPGGTPRSNLDCFYANCVPFGSFTLEWGQAGYDGDNPRLDRDDIPGDGPENINISDPLDGTYTVFVHDYPGSVRQASNTVWVKVYVDGVLLGDFVETITGEDFDWYVCTIAWPSGTVTPF